MSEVDREPDCGGSRNLSRRHPKRSLTAEVEFAPCESVFGSGRRRAQDESEELGPEEAAARELENAKAEAADNYDKLLRAKAELDNYRKRTAKIRVEVREETLRDLLLGLAPIFDNLRRAVGQETDDVVVLKEGIELICGQIEEGLKGYGLEVMEAVGKPFDPNVHEAMMEVESKEHDPGTVVEELDRGYLFGGKVVRPARVVVSKAGEG